MSTHCRLNFCASKSFRNVKFGERLSHGTTRRNDRDKKGVKMLGFNAMSLSLSLHLEKICLREWRIFIDNQFPVSLAHISLKIEQSATVVELYMCSMEDISREHRHNSCQLYRFCRRRRLCQFRRLINVSLSVANTSLAIYQENPQLRSQSATLDRHCILIYTRYYTVCCCCYCEYDTYGDFLLHMKCTTFIFIVFSFTFWMVRFIFHLVSKKHFHCLSVNFFFVFVFSPSL